MVYTISNYINLKQTILSVYSYESVEKISKHTKVGP